MPPRLDSVLHLIRGLFEPGSAATADEQLLRRFVARRDGDAFAELVRRHGPTVLGVCRRVLGNAADAEDAFQVTFLTLACRASTLRRGRALAAWLHRVAYHVALRARRQARRAALVEREAKPMPRPEATEAAWRELGGVLDEELQRLPEQLRGPLVLCGLEGKTHEEAARELGWPTGSLSKRLARGRELLRERLARRGFAVGAALSAVLIGEATASVPPSLLTATVRAGLAAAAGRVGELSAASAALLKETMRAMFWTRTKTVVAVALVGLTLLASAVGLGLLPPGQAAPQASRPPRDDQPARLKPELPRGVVAALGKKKFRFRSWIYGVSYSPDGKLLAMTEYNTIRLFDADTKQELRTWDAPEGFLIRSLAFSPDGQTIATVGQEPKLRLWEAATGKLVREFDVHLSGSWLVVFSPDGKLLATAGEERDPNTPDVKLGFDSFAVRVWDAATGKEAEGFAGGFPSGNCVAFSPDGRLLAWGGYDKKVHVRKPGGGDLFTFTDPDQEVNTITSVDFSPDGKLLAVGDNKVIRLFDLAGKELATLRYPPRAGQPELLDGYRVRFAPGGKTLGSIGQAGFSLWDVATGKLLESFGHPDNLFEFSIHKDGKRLATGGDKVLRFFDLAAGKEEAEPGHQHGINPVAVSPDGKLVVTAAFEDGVIFWDCATGKELRRLPKLQVTALKFIPDGLLVGGDEDHHYAIYDPETGKKLRTVGDMYAGNETAVSADGKLLAVGAGEITVYELPSGKERVKLSGHKWFCFGLAFGPDNKTLVSGGEDPPDMTATPPKPLYHVKLWDLTTGKEIRRFSHPSEEIVSFVAYSPDGKWVLADTGMWEAATGKEISRQPGVLVNRPVFSPDGKLMARPVNWPEPRSKCWVDVTDTTTWESVAKLEGHTDRINSVAFSADGKYLVTGSADCSALVWDLRAVLR